VKREQRLRTPQDFARVRSHAVRGWPHPLLVVYAVPNDLGHSRVGITVSGRVGKAVVRNRIRRRVREAMRARLPRLQSGYDIVIVMRPPSAQASWPDLCLALDTVLGRANLWLPAPNSTSASV
jgi:ribonuclease P protein component